MSDIEHITWIELGEKLEAIVAHCKQRLPGEWPITLDDKFVELMNDACQYFPYEIASTTVLSSSNASTTTPKNPLASEVERLKADNDELAGSNNRLLEMVSERREANAELLAALKNIELDAHSGVTFGDMEEALIKIAKFASQVYTKHSAKDSGE